MLFSSKKKRSAKQELSDRFMRFKIDLLQIDGMLKDDPDLKGLVSREFVTVLEQIEMIKRHNYMTL